MCHVCVLCVCVVCVCVWWGGGPRSDPLQIVLTRTCLYGCGACADLTLNSAALIMTNRTEWLSCVGGQVERQGETDNTVVCIASDHGEMLGAHPPHSAAAGPTRPLQASHSARGHTHPLYELML